MGTHVADGRLILAGELGVEEAETLLGLLLDNPDLPLDLGACAQVHTAVLQVLLASKRAIATPPPSALLAGLLGPTRACAG